MNFIARINLPDHHVPIRAYLHGSGKDAWKPKAVGQGTYVIEKDMDMSQIAKTYTINSLAKISKTLELNFQYLLAVLWGNSDSERVIDCFGYSDISDANWPRNPEVEGWVMREGVYVQKNKITQGGLTCGDSTIIIGKEEEYRRLCPNLKTFMEVPPKIPGLENILEI